MDGVQHLMRLPCKILTKKTQVGHRLTDFCVMFEFCGGSPSTTEDCLDVVVWSEGESEAGGEELRFLQLPKMFRHKASCGAILLHIGSYASVCTSAGWQYSSDSCGVKCLPWSRHKVIASSWRLWSTGDCWHDFLSWLKLNKRWNCWLKAKQSGLYTVPLCCQYITYKKCKCISQP